MYSTAKLLTEEGIEGLGRYYSIYRGIVVDNNDTEKHMNRIKVCCPEVMGGIITWAYAKGQHGSINNGFKYLAPKVGDIVFVTLNLETQLNPYGNIMVGDYNKYQTLWMVLIKWVL